MSSHLLHQKTLLMPKKRKMYKLICIEAAYRDKGKTSTMVIRNDTTTLEGLLKEK
jgi:hypothetical protein